MVQKTRLVVILLYLLSTHFYSLIYAQPTNDNFANAIDISGIINSCSSSAQYTTTAATADGNAGSCWNNSGPKQNVWFKFAATTSQIHVTVDINTGKGSQRRTQLALWESNGTSQLACAVYTAIPEDVDLGYTSLVINHTYYISVDILNSGSQGTFTLCLNDQVDYDFIEGAIDVTALINTCSPDRAYTTINASPDKNAGSCWNNSGPKLNRWFKFTANTSGIKVTVDVNGGKGAQRRTQLALWDSDGITLLDCDIYNFDADDVDVGYTNLNINNTYYISVDTYSDAYDGTFTLCLNDEVDYDYFEGAEDVTNLINTCSVNKAYTTIGASADKNEGSCWNNSGPKLSRWFKFTASSNAITVKVDVNGPKGTQRRTQLSLWEKDGISELACALYTQDAEDVDLGYSSLLKDSTYYISVDTYSDVYDGTFTLCLNDVIDYDYFEGAEDVTTLINSCSTNKVYTTIGASGDKNEGSCWDNSGPKYNRWFKFIASTTEVYIKVDTKGSKGSQTRTQLALWESNGTTQLACDKYNFNDEDVDLGYLSLTPGNTYYISVDTYSTSHYGTFTLCLDDAVDYDFYEGARRIFNLNNFCSSDALFSTSGATSDKNAGTCWNNSGPLFNRWFWFKALTNNLDVTVDIGGIKGTQQRTQLALWSNDGTTLLACEEYTTDDEDVNLSYSSLVPGNIYYISVDSYSTAYAGTFTLCIDNVDETYYAINNGSWNNGNNWSFTEGGTAAGSYPNTGDVANIKGNTMTFDSDITIAAMNVIVETANTGLTVDNATMTVEGAMNMSNSGNNFDGTVSIINGGRINVNGDATFTRAGGDNIFSVSLSGASSFDVGNDMNWDSSAGTTNNNLLTVGNTSTVTVGQDLNLTRSLTGKKNLLTFNNSSSLSVTRDINIVANTTDMCEIEFNGSAMLNLGRDIERGTPVYGILDFNGNTTLVFNSDTYPQNIPNSSGEGSDGLSFRNITINNSRSIIPQVTLNAVLTINRILTLTDGVLSTSSSNLLTIGSGGTVSGGSSDSYIAGPLKKNGNTAFTFPVGSSSRYAPIAISASTNSSAAFTAQYLSSPYSNTSSLGAGLTRISKIEYWDLGRNSGSSPGDDVYVTLYWNSGTFSEIDDLTTLKVSHWTGTEWEDKGNGGTSGSTSSGTIISGTEFDSFSPITFGSGSSGNNPLPVELTYFKVSEKNKLPFLEWETSAEIDNDRFDIERSFDGLSWEKIAFVEGRGNSSKSTNYNYLDNNISVRGLQNLYYRLKQIDFDKSYEYSGVRELEINLGYANFLQVFPNPFHNNTSISYHLPSLSKVNIKIFSLKGNLIETLVDETQKTGYYKYQFGSKTKMTGNGVFLLKISINGEVSYKRLAKID